MSLLKNLFTKLYYTRTIRYFRSETKRKLTAILSPLQTTVNAQSEVLTKQAEVLNEQTKKLDTLSNTVDLQSETQQDIIKYIDGKQDLHTRLLNEANDKHDEQLNFLEELSKKQGFVTYHIYRQELVDKFIKTMHLILKDAFPTIQKYADQLFTEVLIDHMTPGGAWKLRNDLSFFQPPDFPPSSNNSQLTNSTPTKKKLKILIISGCFPSLMHGGGGRLLDIILEFSKSHEIDLYSHFNPDLDKSSLEIISSKVNNIQLTNYDNLNCEMIGGWLRSLNRADKYYDVIQLEYPQTIRFIETLRQYGKKIGFTFMECLALSYAEKLERILETQEYESVSEYAQKFWTAVADEKYALENADFTVAVTSKDKDFLHRLSDHTPQIIPTCVSQFTIIDEATRIQDTPQEENSVMFLGFFGHWPNIEAVKWYLRDIHPKILTHIPEYKFYIVGSGDVSELNKICKGDSSITITGMVESIVPNILRAKVCVSPLISGAGIRGKQNQYSILGRPSVTTSIGNKGLEYKHEESVMIADKADAFANSVIELLTNDQLYNKLQSNAKEIAYANYTWPKQLEKILEIYQAPHTPSNSRHTENGHS